MNTRMVMLAVFAVISAAVTFLLAKTWIDSQRDQLRRQQEAQKASTTESVNVLVAKSNLPAGLILAREHVEWKPWPEKGVAKTFLMEGREKLDDVVGSVVRGGIIAGEPIAKGRVVAPGDRSFLAAVLRPDMRAIAIKVRPEISVAGFIKPGDYVDLVLLHSAIPPTAEAAIRHRIAETILTDVRVIAVDQKPEDQSGDASVSKTVTLEVTRKQVEMVSVATQLGTLTLVLRSLARPDAQPDQISKAPESLSRTWDSEVSHVLPSIGSPKDRVKVIRGNKDSSVSLPSGGADGEPSDALNQEAGETATAGPEGAASAAKVLTP